MNTTFDIINTVLSIISSIFLGGLNIVIGALRKICTTFCRMKDTTILVNFPQLGELPECEDSSSVSDETQNTTTECIPDETNEKILKLRELYLQNRKWFATPEEIATLNINHVPVIKLAVEEKLNVEISVTNVSAANGLHMLEVIDLAELDGISVYDFTPQQIEQGATYKILLKVCFASCGNKIFPFTVRLESGGCNYYLLIEQAFNVSGEIDEELKLRISEADRVFAEENKTSVGVNSIDGRITVKHELITKIMQEELITFGKLKFSVTLPKVSHKHKEDEDNFPVPLLKVPYMQHMNDEDKLPVILPKVPYMYKKDENEHPIPSYLNKLLNNNRPCISTLKEQEIRENLRSMILKENGTNEQLTEINYVKRQHLLMWIEEHQARKELQSFDKIGIPLQKTTSYGEYKIEMPGLAEGRPSLLKGDMILVNKKGSELWFRGWVKEVEKSAFLVKINKSWRISFTYSKEERVNIKFVLNRKNLEVCHEILDTVKRRKLESLLFPAEYGEQRKSVNLMPFFNQSIDGNTEQMQAVKCIVQNEAYPAPYILFGPPGTGKTSTLVEAITQVWSVFRSSKICVCASSNTAADVITKRLLKYIPEEKMYRFYGLSRSEAEIPSEFKNFCNVNGVSKRLYEPPMCILQEKEVIIVTPVTANRLVHKSLSFDYLFMDEAGHTLEVEMLIPIVKLLKSENSTKTKGSLILAGDPQQLGPVVRSSLATHLGYGMSILERFMKQNPLYKKNPSTDQYNPKVITKLVNNYRSHRTILEVPNSRFYDSELLPQASSRIVSCACTWEDLPTPQFPILFHSIKGNEERENNSPSYFNMAEIKRVTEYARKLLRSGFKNRRVTVADIGIITPYRKQVQKLRDHLKQQRMEEITVASVEEFQGQEKLVIIISTVRSRFESVPTDYKFGLGFLRNEKRFNVAVTRAMALLIVVGNPDILQCDPNWRSLLNYCVKNNSFKGEEPIKCKPCDFDPNAELAKSFKALVL